MIRVTMMRMMYSFQRQCVAYYCLPSKRRVDVVDQDDDKTKQVQTGRLVERMVLSMMAQSHHKDVQITPTIWNHDDDTVNQGED